MLIHVKEFIIDGYDGDMRDLDIKTLLFDSEKSELRLVEPKSYKDLYHQEHYRYRKVPFIAESEDNNTIITDDGKIICLYESNETDYYSVHDLFSDTPGDDFGSFNQEKVHLIDQIKEWRTPKKVFLAEVNGDGDVIFNPHIIYRDNGKTVFTSDMDYTGYGDITLDDGKYGLYQLTNSEFEDFVWSNIVLNWKKYIRIHIPEIQSNNIEVSNLNSYNIDISRIDNDIYLSFDRYDKESLGEKLEFNLKVALKNKPNYVTVFVY